jgi:DNA-binding IclR family transcriptional regulator
MTAAEADPVGERHERLPHPAAELTGRQPKAIVHALDVLEAVARHGPGVTAAEISVSLGLSPATSYRLLNLLVAEEYLVRLPDLSGFALGRRAIEFAGVAAPAAWPPVPRRARAVVARVRGAVRWGVHLALCSESGLAHIADEDPDHPAQLADGGGDSPLGRLCADLRDSQALADLPLIDGPVVGEGILAVAVRDDAGRLVAALLVTGPTEPLRRAVRDLRTVLTPAAEELGELLS